MSMAATTYGLEDVASYYAKTGRDLGKLMGLFDVASEETSAMSWAQQHPEWLRVASCTAWGTFNWMRYVGSIGQSQRATPDEWDGRITQRPSD